MKRSSFICPFCKSTEKLKWGEYTSTHKTYSDKSSLVECEHCGVFYTFPTPDEKALAEIYSEEYHYRPNSFIDKLLYLYTLTFDLHPDLSLVKKYKQKGRVLDIGAGRGDFLTQFSAEDYELWAHDPYISKNDLAILSRKIGKNMNAFKTLDKYPPGYFDVILLRNTIEHTTEFLPLLKSIKKLLKSNGVLFIRTPNINSVDFKVFRTNWYEVKMPGHIAFFNSNSIKHVLTSLEFSVKYCKPIGRSFPLSLQRSTNLKYPYLLIVLLSILFSLISPMIGEGGDLRVIARK
jgi:2-polyprenyl-3-methyl-5-hydroxy-6-metoxy-1,4-benzoquinol methylase